MKIEDLLVMNEYNQENYDNIVSVIEEAAEYFGVTVDITGTSMKILSGSYADVLMDIENMAVPQLRAEYPEVF